MNTYQALVTRYFHACSYESAEQIALCFCSDAVVYDVNHQPVEGAQAIGTFYVKIRNQWRGASWHVDTFIGGEAGAAIEWTMLVPHDDETVAVRGSEHYEFRDDLIRQIRQYWRFDPSDLATGLKNYPYKQDKRFIST